MCTMGLYVYFDFIVVHVFLLFVVYLFMVVAFIYLSAYWSIDLSS